MDQRIRARLVNDLRRKFDVSEARADLLVDSGLATVRKVREAPVEAFEQLRMVTPKLRVLLGPPEEGILSKGDSGGV